MTTAQVESGGAQSVDRALSLLTLIARWGGEEVPMTALTAQSGLSRPTVRRMLLALMRSGLVEQNPVSRNYALGPESYVVGLMAQRRFNLLDFAMDSLKDLAAESGDSSFVSMRRGAYSVCLHREEGSYPIRTQALQVGYRHPLGVGAGAMAILAAMPDEELALMRQEITPLLAKGYDRYTPEVVDQSIAQCRRNGWALNPGLYLANSWAIGVAIKAPTGDVLGALSIAAIDSRMGEDRQKDLAKMLLREAAKIEAKLRRRLGYT